MFKFKKSYLFIVAVLICGIGVLSVPLVKAEGLASTTPSITVLSPNGGETWDRSWEWV